MIPPMLSSTMNSDVVLGKTGNSEGSKTQKAIEDEEKSSGGRPEKEDNQKSDKTIANKESMS